MRWTREDCLPVRFATPTVDCETRPLKKRAKWRRRRVTRKLLRRVWSSPHSPIRSAPAAAEPGVAAVVLVAEQAAPEGSCHTLKVKLNHGGGMNVRSRTGYCNARSANVLEGTPVEKQLELRAHDVAAVASAAPVQVPYFYSGANVARVNLAMDIPGESFHFD